MTRPGLTVVLSHATMVAGVTTFLAYVDFHLSESGVLSTASTYLVLRALVCWAAVVFVQCLASPALRTAVVVLYSNHLGILGALLGIVLCSFLFALLPTAYWNDGPMYLLYPVYDALVVVLAMLLPFHERHRRYFRWYLLGAFLVLVGSVICDAWYPGTFSVVPDRAAGFPRNPNTAAFVLLLLCSSVVDLDRFRWRDVGIWALAGIGVFATLSRAGGILLACALAFYTYRIVRSSVHHPSRLLRPAAASLLLSGTVYLAGLLLVERAEMFSLPFQPRLEMYEGTQAVVPEDEARIEAMLAAVELVSRSPVIGYGTGYSYSMMELTPHNMYLQQWINNGLPGLAAYLLLLAAAAHIFGSRRSARGVLFISLVAINGLFSHNILEERAFLVLLGVLLTSSFHDVYPDASRNRWPVRQKKWPHLPGVRI